MTGNKSYFVKLEENMNSEVALRDGKVQKVERRGTIAVITKSDQQRVIKDVLYVPKIAQDLLSIGQLLDKGYKVIFNVGICLVIDKKKSQLRTFSITMPPWQNSATTTSLSVRQEKNSEGELIC